MAAPRKLRLNQPWIQIAEPRGFGDLLACHGALAAGISVLFAIAWWLTPGQVPIEICRLHAWTGIACPTCGGTRVFHALCHGAWREALHLSPFLTGVFLILFILWSTSVAGLLLYRIVLPGERLIRLIRSRRVWWGLAVLWAVDWMYRVVLLYPKT